MKPCILLIQFRAKIATAHLEAESLSRELGGDVCVKTISALHESDIWQSPEQLLMGIEGVILGGSGDFDFDGNREVSDPLRQTSYKLLEKLRPVLIYLFAYDIPTLGICYGHQLIGAFKGTRVHHDPVQSKMKSHQVEVLDEALDHILCQGLPRTFVAQYGHKDVLATIPADARLVMCGGERCKLSALAYQKNIFTTQFHPELTVADMHKRVAATPGYLPEGVTVDEIFEESPAANQIVSNFAKFVICHGTTTYTG